MKYPALPKEIMGLAGPIKIDRPLVVDPANPDNIGMWLSDERRVLVKSTLKRPIAWLTLLHELGHAALTDAGVFRLSYTKEEQVVEAIASGTIHVIRHLLSQADNTSRVSAPRLPESP